MSAFEDLTDAATETRAHIDMILERQPGLAPLIEAQMEKLAAELADTFQPWTDLAEGKITEDEFARVMEQRRQADLAARLEMYENNVVEDDDDDEPIAWEIDCSNCFQTVVFRDEPPPLHYPTCADAGEESCEDEDDDDPDAD